jgi:hypothetical protein
MAQLDEKLFKEWDDNFITRAVHNSKKREKWPG